MKSQKTSCGAAKSLEIPSLIFKTRPRAQRASSPVFTFFYPSAVCAHFQDVCSFSSKVRSSSFSFPFRSDCVWRTPLPLFPLSLFPFLLHFGSDSERVSTFAIKRRAAQRRVCYLPHTSTHAVAETFWHWPVLVLLDRSALSCYSPPSTTRCLSTPRH